MFRGVPGSPNQRFRLLPDSSRTLRRGWLTGVLLRLLVPALYSYGGLRIPCSSDLQGFDLLAPRREVYHGDFLNAMVLLFWPCHGSRLGWPMSGRHSQVCFMGRVLRPFTPCVTSDLATASQVIDWRPHRGFVRNRGRVGFGGLIPTPATLAGSRLSPDGRGSKPQCRSVQGFAKRDAWKGQIIVVHTLYTADPDDTANKPHVRSSIHQ